MKDWLLLEQSGELGAPRRRRVRAHVARCPACRAYRAALPRLRDAARSPAALTTLEPHLVARLHAAAERRGAATAGTPGWLHAVRLSATALATAAVVATAFTWRLRPGEMPNKAPGLAVAPGLTEPDGVDVRLDLLSEELAAFRGDSPGGGSGVPAADTDELATELLRLEGIEI